MCTGLDKSRGWTVSISLDVSQGWAVAITVWTFQRKDCGYIRFGSVHNKDSRYIGLDVYRSRTLDLLAIKADIQELERYHGLKLYCLHRTHDRDGTQREMVQHDFLWRPLKRNSQKMLDFNHFRTRKRLIIYFFVLISLLNRVDIFHDIEMFFSPVSCHNRCLKVKMFVVNVKNIF